LRTQADSFSLSFVSELWGLWPDIVSRKCFASGAAIGNLRLEQFMNIIAAIRLVVWAVGFVAPVAMSQTTASPQHAPEATTMTGTVASSSRNTLVVRTESGSYQLFVFDRFTTKPASVPVGSTVRVVSTPGGEPGVRIASNITVSSTAPATSPPAESTDVVPTSVRQLESDIERQVRRYGAGFRAGVGLDPELLLIGAHARLGPFFNRNVSFRPNAEYAFGEVTKLFAFNLEGIYRLPFTPRQGRWSAYVGAGPSFVFSRQDFERAGIEDGGDIDFDDFEYDTGLNILTGVEFRSGLFFEAKTTVYAAPHLRLIVGYTF
jgi:hypothetical protein